MFYYNKKFDLSLIRYGIHVPLLDIRGQEVFQYIKQQFPSKVLEPENDLAMSPEILGLAHNSTYVKKILDNPEQALIETYELIDESGKYHRFDPDNAEKPLKALCEPIFNQTLGAIAALRAATKQGFGFNLGGGLHHAMTFGGRGFCLINDIIIAARWGQKNLGLQNIWIIDVDAHKGDGTAEIAQSDPSLVTFSIHMKKGWPLDSAEYDSQGKRNPWFLPSNYDVGVAASDSEIYLPSLQKGLDQLASENSVPDLAIVVQGSDPYEKDELESANELKLSKQQMLQRDQMVYQFLKKLNVPQCYLMSGGYGSHVHEIYIQFLEGIKDELQQN